MRSSVSSENLNLLNSLHRPASIWTNRTKEKLSELAAIAEAREPAAMFGLVPILLDRSAEVRRATADTIANLMALVSANDYFWLDQEMRARSPYHLELWVAWNQMEPRKVRGLADLGPNWAFAIGMASFHRSGFVRQEAVRQLANCCSGHDLPFLLVRLNDWVDEVRREAAHILRERLESDHVRCFVANAPLLMRLKETSRGRTLRIVLAIDNRLKGAAAREALKNSLTSSDRMVRRYSFKLLLGPDSQSDNSITEMALADPDPIIRHWVTATFASIPDSDLARRLLAKAMENRFASVRRVALQHSIERFPNEAGPWLERALLDAHPSVRGLAQFTVDAQRASTSRNFYLDRLLSPDIKILYGAVSGIGEVGERSDCVAVMRYANHEVPMIRRAAMRSLGRLNPGEYVGALFSGLADGSAPVSREAARSLSTVAHLLSASRLWNLFEETSHSHVRRNVLFAMSRLSKWESIGPLVEALCSDDPTVTARAEIYIRRWYGKYNRSFMAPTPAQKAQIARALESCNSRSLDGWIRDLLRLESKAQP